MPPQTLAVQRDQNRGRALTFKVVSAQPENLGVTQLPFPVVTDDDPCTTPKRSPKHRATGPWRARVKLVAKVVTNAVAGQIVRDLAKYLAEWGWSW